jgi:sugar phosphate isomerase/epimerase
MGEVLREVAAIGYEGVEFAGLNGLSAEDVAGTCRAVGLDVCGAHVPLSRFEAKSETVARELMALGTDRLVFPSLEREETDHVLSPAQRLAGAAEQARGLGLVPTFHNHDSEFRPSPSGGRAWDDVLTIPGLELELDLGWAWVAGEDPSALLRDCKGRCRMVHAKDHRQGVDGMPDTPVGDGDIGYDSIVPVAREVGVEWLIVEQDEPGADPLGAVRRSFHYLDRLLSEESPRRRSRAFGLERALDGA